MEVIEIAAVVLVAVLGWGLFAYLSPYRSCRWCTVFASVGMRCRRCHGTKLTRRLGAKQVHKVGLALRQAWEER